MESIKCKRCERTIYQDQLNIHGFCSTCVYWILFYYEGKLKTKGRG